ncbi:iron-containing redox enzyme family protein [Bordetella genomosp. 9]|nr:iron-containing redox enzyme family protein [Bordetella genomosp. 9]
MTCSSNETIRMARRTAELATDAAPSGGMPHKELYQQMVASPDDARTLEASGAWLAAKLAGVDVGAAALPADPQDLYAWMDANVDAVGDRYQQYLARRKAGGPREMFPTRSHALYFLAQVAPTKLVDGSWLYGSLRHQGDPRFEPLISTYLEELGMGDEAQNHVTLFLNLLRSTGADGWEPTDDSLYEQGATQLAIGLHGHTLTAEMAGFNLGYEQLPYHLHVTAYELDELGIDPYYFTVHVTVDNAGSGHARQAVDAVLRLMPEEPVQRAAFYERVKRGFLLNDVGVSSTAIAASFDPQQVVTEIFRKKSRYGRAAHADYCRIAGRTVNAWLSDPDNIPEFLQALQQKNWIVRHQDPSQSRFWALLSGTDACMFGVFNSFELQAIYDWIAGDCKEYLEGPQLPGRLPRVMVNGRHLSFRAARRHAALAGNRERSLAASSDLLAKLAPGSHYTPEGLAATRTFAEQARQATTV